MNIGVIYLVTTEMLKGSSQDLLAYLDVIESAEAVQAVPNCVLPALCSLGCSSVSACKPNPPPACPPGIPKI